MLRSKSKSLGNHVVSPEEEKESCSGKDLQKRKVPANEQLAGLLHHMPMKAFVN